MKREKHGNKCIWCNLQTRALQEGQALSTQGHTMYQAHFRSKRHVYVYSDMFPGSLPLIFIWHFSEIFWNRAWSGRIADAPSHVLLLEAGKPVVIICRLLLAEPAFYIFFAETLWHCTIKTWQVSPTELASSFSMLRPVWWCLMMFDVWNVKHQHCGRFTAGAGDGSEQRHGGESPQWWPWTVPGSRGHPFAEMSWNV